MRKLIFALAAASAVSFAVPASAQTFYAGLGYDPSYGYYGGYAPAYYGGYAPAYYNYGYAPAYYGPRYRRPYAYYGGPRYYRGYRYGW